MKRIITLCLLSGVFFAFHSYASPNEKFEIRRRPPEALNPVFLRYQGLPQQKVIVIAVDAGGNWAFGYDHSRSSLEEAAKAATVKCDAARKKNKVRAKAKLFAINDDIVYYDKQFK